MKPYIYLFIFTLFFSCSDNTPIHNEEPPINYNAQNEADIIKYIADNNLNAKKSDSGLYYVIENLGTGATPINTSKITVTYKGYYINNKVFNENDTDDDGVRVFDESDTDGVTFNLQELIKGWVEGITYFKEGGNGILIIPSRLAYGSNGNGIIPPNTVLIYEIKLLKVN